MTNLQSFPAHQKMQIRASDFSIPRLRHFSFETPPRKQKKKHNHIGPGTCLLFNKRQSEPNLTLPHYPELVHVWAPIGERRTKSSFGHSITAHRRHRCINTDDVTGARCVFAPLLGLLVRCMFFHQWNPVQKCNGIHYIRFALIKFVY